MSETPPPSAFPSMAVGFGMLFISTSMVMQWLPVWFEEIGLSATTIGLIVGVGMLGRFVGAPLFGMLADYLDRTRLIYAGLHLALMVLYALYLLRPDTAVFLVLAFAVGLATGPLVPLIDAIAIEQSATRGLHYGRARSVGSFTFIVAAMAGGYLIVRFPEDVVLWWIIGFSGLSALSALALPRDPPPHAPVARGRWSPHAMASVLTQRPLLMVLTVSALVQGSHAFYYSFSTIAWRDQGYANLTIGMLWAWAVIAEILLLTLFGRTLEAWGARALLLLGALAALIRWGAYALEPGLAALIVLQTLHAGTYACTHMGFIVYTRAHVPRKQRATTQSVNSALTLGGVLAGATALSGVLYEEVGSTGYLAMALIAAVAIGVLLFQSRLTGEKTGQSGET